MLLSVPGGKNYVNRTVSNRQSYIRIHFNPNKSYPYKRSEKLSILFCSYFGNIHLWDSTNKQKLQYSLSFAASIHCWYSVHFSLPFFVVCAFLFHHYRRRLQFVVIIHHLYRPTPPSTTPISQTNWNDWSSLPVPEIIYVLLAHFYNFTPYTIFQVYAYWVSFIYSLWSLSEIFTCFFCCCCSLAPFFNCCRCFAVRSVKRLVENLGYSCTLLQFDACIHVIKNLVRPNKIAMNRSALEISLVISIFIGWEWEEFAVMKYGTHLPGEVIVYGELKINRSVQIQEINYFSMLMNLIRVFSIYNIWTLKRNGKKQKVRGSDESIHHNYKLFLFVQETSERKVKQKENQERKNITTELLEIRYHRNTSRKKSNEKPSNLGRWIRRNIMEKIDERTTKYNIFFRMIEEPNVMVQCARKIFLLTF